MPTPVSREKRHFFRDQGGQENVSSVGIWLKGDLPIWGLRSTRVLRAENGTYKAGQPDQERGSIMPELLLLGKVPKMVHLPAEFREIAAQRVSRWAAQMLNWGGWAGPDCGRCPRDEVLRPRAGRCRRTCHRVAVKSAEPRVKLAASTGWKHEFHGPISVFSGGHGCPTRVRLAGPDRCTGAGPWKAGWAWQPAVCAIAVVDEEVGVWGVRGHKPPLTSRAANAI